MHPLNLPSVGRLINTDKGPRTISLGKYKIDCTFSLCGIDECGKIVYLITQGAKQDLNQYEGGRDPSVYVVLVSKISELKSGDLLNTYEIFWCYVKELYPLG